MIVELFLQHQLRRTLPVRSFYCSAPCLTTTDSQRPPQDDQGMSLDHFRKPIHPSTTGEQEDERSDGYTLPHPVWSEEELNSVQITHSPPEKPVDTVWPSLVSPQNSCY